MYVSICVARWDANFSRLRWLKKAEIVRNTNFYSLRFWIPVCLLVYFIRNVFGSSCDSFGGLTVLSELCVFPILTKQVRAVMLPITWTCTCTYLASLSLAKSIMTVFAAISSSTFYCHSTFTGYCPLITRSWYWVCFHPVFAVSNQLMSWFSRPSTTSSTPSVIRLTVSFLSSTIVFSDFFLFGTTVLASSEADPEEVPDTLKLTFQLNSLIPSMSLFPLKMLFHNDTQFSLFSSLIGTLSWFWSLLWNAGTFSLV